MTEYFDHAAIKTLAEAACTGTAWHVIDVARGSCCDTWCVGLEHKRKVFKAITMVELPASEQSADMITDTVRCVVTEPLAFAEYDHGDPAPSAILPVRHLLVPGKRGHKARRLPIQDFEVGDSFTVTAINRDTGELTLTFNSWPWRPEPLRKGPLRFAVVKP